MYNILRLSIVSEALNSAGVNWWIDHGTLLGILRDSRLLPWDEDIDLSIFEEELEKSYEILKTVIPRLSAHLIKTNRNIKIIPYSPKDKSIDLSFYRKLQNQAYQKNLVEFPRNETLKTLFLRKLAWRRCRKIERKLRLINKKNHKEDSIAQKMLNRITFFREKLGVNHYSIVPEKYFQDFTSLTWQNLTLPIPKNPEDYLQFRYGDNWKIPISNWKWWRDDMSVNNSK